jgi:hypothetical protein
LNVHQGGKRKTSSTLKLLEVPTFAFLPVDLDANMIKTVNFELIYYFSFVISFSFVVT